MRVFPQHAPLTCSLSFLSVLVCFSFCSGLLFRVAVVVAWKVLSSSCCRRRRLHPASHAIPALDFLQRLQSLQNQFNIILILFIWFTKSIAIGFVSYTWHCVKSRFGDCFELSWKDGWRISWGNCGIRSSVEPRPKEYLLRPFKRCSGAVLVTKKLMGETNFF